LNRIGRSFSEPPGGVKGKPYMQKEEKKKERTKERRREEKLTLKKTVRS